MCHSLLADVPVTGMNANTKTESLSMLAVQVTNKKSQNTVCGGRLLYGLPDKGGDVQLYNRFKPQYKI